MFFFSFLKSRGQQPAAMLGGLLTACPLAHAAEPPAPSPAQRAQIERKYGMFCHFGINTFLDQEWSDGTAPAAAYAPTALDADSWVVAAKAAGMRYFILTTKHHDGFCLWDSRWTDYDVAASGHRTDVVKAVADACRRHGLQLAVYYSLWDRHEPSYRGQDFAAYVDYVKRQLSELLTGYGPVCEIWFDGAWDRPEEDWRIPEIYRHVKSLQPDCLVTVNRNVGRPGVGLGEGDIAPYHQKTGDPLRYFPTDFRTHDPLLPAFPDPKVFAHGADLHYLPFESTVTLSSADQWFHHPAQTGTKPLGVLERCFEIATAQDNLLVFNAAPDRAGRLLEGDVAALKELARRLGLEAGRPFPRNLAATARATAGSVWENDAARWGPALAVDEDPDTRWASAAGESGETSWLELAFEKPQIFRRAIVREFIENGAGRCQAFALEVEREGVWREIHRGATLGESARIDFEPVTASGLRLKILAASGPVSIHSLKLQD